MERNNQNNYWEALGKVEARICEFRTPPRSGQQALT